jgi:hypothetical protein
MAPELLDEVISMGKEENVARWDFLQLDKTR